MLTTVAKSRFGVRLRAIREEQGLTQKDLGEAVAMSPQAIARLEAGTNEPTWPTVLKLAKALDVEVGAFQSEEDEE